MNIIRPTTITAAMLQSSNVPETDGDHGEWDVGHAYVVGDTVRVTAVHKVYECLTNVTGGSSPEVDVLAAVPKWLETGSTNRWKPFDESVQAQATQATMMNWVLNPGLVDSIALLNLDATETQIIMADQDLDLVTNGTAWTGATGTTQPTGWDKVGTPSDFLIDSGALKITADAVNEGISQTITVVAETEYQFLGIYRNTAGDIAQYAVYDVTHSADILATTDLASSVVDSTLSYVFTTPAGCISIKISLMAKANGDIVWFDKISLSDVVYNETTDLISSIQVIDWYTYFFEPIVRITDMVKTDLAAVGLPPISTASLTVIITYTGGTAKIGEIVVGTKFSIGGLLFDPTIGITSYSTKEVDAFGNMTVTPRAYAKRLAGTVQIKNTIRAEVVRQMTLYRDVPVVWIGSEQTEDGDLTIYGYVKSFDASKNDGFSSMSFEIEGLT